MVRKGNHTMVDVECFHCGLEFQRALTDYNTTKKRGGNQFCSIKCKSAYGLTKRAEKYKTTESDFWSSIDKSPGYGPQGECWEWQGVITASGYGSTSLGRDQNTPGKKGPRQAHRVSYSLLVGEIPEDLLILHSCDNRKCVNPAHLRVGTQKDNMQDALGRGRFPIGEVSPSAILTNDQVKEIKLLLLLEYSQSYLAEIFGVESGTINSISVNKAWKSIQITSKDLAQRSDLLERCRLDREAGRKECFARPLKKEVGKNKPSKPITRYINPWL